MARLRNKHTFILSDDTAGLAKLYERADDTNESTDAYAKGNSKRYDVGPSTTTSIDLDGLTNVGLVYVESDKEVKLIINGVSALELPITPQASTVTGAAALPGRIFLMTSGVTSLSVKNASGTDTAKVRVAFAGS